MRWAAAQNRYRLDVIAANVADVVGSAGGWLFDRAMAGWDVNVVTADRCDVRPLQILGITTRPLDSTAQRSALLSRTQALALATDVFTTDACVRRNVISALDRGLAEVTLWGKTRPAQLGARVGEVEHRLSTAARAFKAHALVAAGIGDDAVRSTETFLAGVRWYPPVPARFSPWAG